MASHSPPAPAAAAACPCSAARTAACSARSWLQGTPSSGPGGLRRGHCESTRQVARLPNQGRTRSSARWGTRRAWYCCASVARAATALYVAWSPADDFLARQSKSYKKSLKRCCPCALSKPRPSSYAAARVNSSARAVRGARDQGCWLPLLNWLTARVLVELDRRRHGGTSPKLVAERGGGCLRTQLDALCHARRVALLNRGSIALTAGSESRTQRPVRERSVPQQRGDSSVEAARSAPREAETGAPGSVMRPRLTSAQQTWRVAVGSTHYAGMRASVFQAGGS